MWHKKVACPLFSRRAFTLVEVMIATSIFVVVIAFVLSTIVNTFQSTSRARETSRQQQEMRFAFFRIGKEINSITTASANKPSFKGDESQFFFVFAQADTISEAGYIYNPSNKSVEYFYQQRTDYDFNTHETKRVLIENVESWKFSYWDGSAWHDSWPTEGSLPKAVKIIFKFTGDKDARETTINIPIGQ